MNYYNRPNARGCPFCMAARETQERTRQEWLEANARVVHLELEISRLRANRAAEIGTLNLVMNQRDAAWRANTELRAQLESFRRQAGGRFDAE